MAIATGTAIALGVSAAAGAATAISGAARAKRAKKALQNFKRQELSQTEGLRVSTLGAELQTEAALQRQATSVDALQAGGVRGLVGGLGRVEAAQGQQQRQISADLDRQQMQIERMQFQEAQSLRQMQESRENFQIGALMSEQQAGQQAVTAGLTQIGSAAMSGLTSMDSMQAKDPFVGGGVKSTMKNPALPNINPIKSDYSNFGMDTVKRSQNMNTSLTGNSSDFSRFIN
jgi:hypothetical protein